MGSKNRGEVMRVHGIAKLQHAARRLKHQLTRGGVVLMYHSVAEVDSDPWSLSVTPRHFAEHLEVLRKRSYPMQLQQLTQTLQDGACPQGAVAITFDDGYANNLHNAKPLLERYDIPATVFVIAGCVRHEHEFWWDELERLLLQPGILPETLHLSINSSTYQRELGESANYSEVAYQRHRHWEVEQEDNPSPRHSLYLSLWQQLRPLSEGERHRVLDELLVWAGAEPASRLTHRPLSLTEVSALAQGNLIEVGSHTLTHPFLSMLPVALQQDEIQRSKARLEELIQHPVSSFAYPHGDYTEETVALVQEAGFTCACSTNAAAVWRHTDRFELPRFHVQDWDGEEFARQLSRWFHV